jgi:CheY-like chemotaxis protein
MPEAPTILVVDDEEVVLNFVAMVLKRAGFRVLAASGSEEALALTNGGGEPLDLALLDIVMPRMDGPALSNALHEFYPDLRVLFMSGFNVEEVNRRVGGPADFLKKPFTASQLLERVRQAVERPTSFPA